MKHCVMITAIGKSEWITSAIKYAYPIIKQYFENNNHEVHLVTETEFASEVQHPSWLWLKCHDILPNYDYILTWNLDILPVKFDDDIFKGIDFSKIGAIMEDASVHNIFPHFKHNCGMVGVPKYYHNFCKFVYDKWKHNPNNWPSHEQYYVNMEIGENKIEVQSIPKKYAWYHSTPQYESATCWHYTFAIDKKDVAKMFEDHYNKYYLKS